MTQPRSRPRVTIAEQLFEQWLARQPTVRLLCRINGHWWEGYEGDDGSRIQAVPRPVRPGMRRSGSYLLTLNCQRSHDGEGCGVVVRRFFGNDWTPTMNSYFYPSDPPYMTPNGIYVNKFRRARIRLELDIRAGEQ